MNSTEYSEESLPKKKAKNDYFNNLRPISSNPHNFIQINLTENLLTKPACIGEFSLDKSRLPSLGRSQARYFYEASLGFDKFKKEEKEDEGLLVLMRWILAMSVPDSSLKKSIHECDFIVWRGTITRLMFSCYDTGPNSVGVKVACCKFKEKMCFAGHKFEQIVTVEDLNMKPNTSQNVDLNSEFVGIFKALKWWIQSYLASIKQLVIGLHENLQLNRVELIEVNSLFKYFSRENLNSSCCFAFLYLFLQTIKSYLDKGMEEDILVAERLPNSNEFNFQLFEKGSEMANNYCVLSEEFK
uniref:Decapping nuclease n=1 Tax=Meloidogyne javanica TaxID=6303 RepID=A0A915N8S8_MELJA